MRNLQLSLECIFARSMRFDTILNIQISIYLMQILQHDTQQTD